MTIAWAQVTQFMQRVYKSVLQDIEAFQADHPEWNCFPSLEEYPSEIYLIFTHKAPDSGRYRKEVYDFYGPRLASPSDESMILVGEFVGELGERYGVKVQRRWMRKTEYRKAKGLLSYVLKARYEEFERE